MAHRGGHRACGNGWGSPFELHQAQARLATKQHGAGLDQVPESLFPTLLIMHPLGLEVLDLIVIVIAFFVGELGLSRLLFTLRIRDEPY